MKLPFFGKKFNKTENLSEVFAVVRITPSTVQTALCNVEGDGRTSLVSSSEFLEWAGADVDSNKDDDLLEMVDQGLAQVMPFLPEEIDEPSKVLFGIPAKWVENGLPLAKYKELLKKVASELDLKAMGFAVTSEAVINFLNKEEAASVTGLVVTVDKDWVEVSLTFNGKVQQVEVAGREKNLVDSLRQLIAKLPATQLPARILVFDGGEDLSTTREELANFDWVEANLGFLHIPKIDLLPNDAPIKSLVLAAGQALGRNIHMVGSWNQRELVKGTEPTEAMGDSEEVENIGQEIPEKPNIEDLSQAIEGELVRAENNGEGEMEVDVPIEGFVMGEDIKEVGERETEERRNPDAVRNGAGVETPMPSGTGQAEEQSNLRPVGIVAESNLNQNMKMNEQKIRRQWFKGWKFRLPWKWMIVGILVVGLMGGGLYALYASTTAEVTIVVKPEPLENELSVVVDANAAETDVENGRLPGKVLGAVAEGAKSKGTSGKKTVGENASGEVTIFNDTDAIRTLDAGTVLTSDGKGLKFTLDQQVQVASKSVDLAGDSPFKPGVAKGAVTADEIGAEHNLDANSTFTVANLSQSSILARNESAFSGGSSREIQAVAEADLISLSDELNSELESQALEKLKGQLGEGQELIESSVTSEVVDENFDYDAGDEADSLSLEMELRFAGVAYSKQEFDRLIADQMSSRVPINKELSDVVSTDFQLQENDDENEFVFRVVTKSYLLPKLSPENIKDKIAGKRPSVAKDYLLSLPSVSRIRNELKPNLPDFLEFLSRFPWSQEKIEVKVVVEE